MLGKLLKPIIKIISETPILRTVLIVLSVFYVIKNKVLYDQKAEEGFIESREVETEEQRKYRESQRWTGISLSVGLFILLMFLRHINIKAEREELRKQREEFLKNHKGKNENLGNDGKGDLEQIDEEDESDEGIPWKPSGEDNNGKEKID